MDIGRRMGKTNTYPYVLANFLSRYPELKVTFRYLENGDGTIDKYAYFSYNGIDVEITDFPKHMFPNYKRKDDYNQYYKSKSLSLPP